MLSWFVSSARFKTLTEASFLSFYPGIKWFKEVVLSKRIPYPKSQMAMSRTFLIIVTWIKDDPARRMQSNVQPPQNIQDGSLLHPPPAPNKESLTQNVNGAEADRFSCKEAEVKISSLKKNPGWKSYLILILVETIHQVQGRQSVPVAGRHK